VQALALKFRLKYNLLNHLFINFIYPFRLYGYSTLKAKYISGMNTFLEINNYVQHPQQDQEKNNPLKTHKSSLFIYIFEYIFLEV
jgi:hypothetical protein